MTLAFLPRRMGAEGIHAQASSGFFFLGVSLPHMASANRSARRSPLCFIWKNTWRVSCLSPTREARRRQNAITQVGALPQTTAASFHGGTQRQYWPRSSVLPFTWPFWQRVPHRYLFKRPRNLLCMRGPLQASADAQGYSAWDREWETGRED